MAPPRKHALPETQLVALLAECRRRGFEFESAWRLTVQGGGRIVLANDRKPPELAVRWPSDHHERHDILRAIEDTKDAYRRAYERAPMTSADRAVLALCDMIDMLAQSAPTVTTPGWRTATATAAHMRTRPAQDRQPVPAP